MKYAAVFMGVVSVAATACGKEFGEWAGRDRTVKGEIAFPVHESMDQEAPYRGLEFGSATVCGLCHPAETKRSDLPDLAVESGALAPLPRQDVPIPDVHEEQRACNHELEPYRCAILDALFEFGPVIPTAFPADVPKFLRTL